jgi:hypothetical protein
VGLHRGGGRARWGHDVNAKNFFIDALTSALDLGIATPFDVIRHVTPDVLAEHLPRPLWARLFTACLGAPKVDAQLIVETVGVQNICEHVPSPIVWGVIAEIGARSLGQAVPDRPVFVAKESKSDSAAPTAPAANTKTEPTKAGSTPATGIPTTKRPPAMTPPKPLPVASPPPVETKTTLTPAPPPPGPSIPSPGSAPADDERNVPARARTPTGQRFRQTSTNIGRLAANQRRPQASAQAPEPDVRGNAATTPTPTLPNARGSRPPTEIDVDIETEIANGSADWQSAISIDDELVDWSNSEETQTSTDDAAFGKRRP